MRKLKEVLVRTVEFNRPRVVVRRGKMPKIVLHRYQVVHLLSQFVLFAGMYYLKRVAGVAVWPHLLIISAVVVACYAMTVYACILYDEEVV